MDDRTVSAKLRERLRGGGSDDGSETLVLSEQEGYVGDTITITGRGFEADGEYALRWHSTEGSWAVLQANEVRGPQYQPRVDEIMAVRADESGAFEVEWTVPRDYGGPHLVEVVDADEETVAGAQYTVTPWFELEESEVELGETVVVTGYGIGPDVVRSNYQLSWDNCNVGFMTGVMNRGTATAQLRAVGPPGEHVLQVWRNYRGVPYLQNNTQSRYGPVGGDRQSAWTVTVTEPDERPRTTWVDHLFDEDPIETHYPDIDADTDAELEVTPSSGKPGTTVFLTGQGFPPSETVDLVWYRHEGHPASGAPITPEPHRDVLPTVETDADGTFQAEVTIPRDQGSTRPITAEVGGESVAVTGFMMQPDIETFVPTRGPPGTTIEVELSGIGWTAYEKAPYFLYDNKPLGHVANVTAEEEPGLVRAELKAAGDPGWHFIDVYPTIFEMDEDEPDYELRPHLSYLDNHPMRPLPGLHMAFEVTEE